MTYPPEQPSQGVEYPPLQGSAPQADPYAPVDYPTSYPPLPPVYPPPPVGAYPPPPVGAYPPPSAAGYPSGYPGYPGYPGYFADPYDPYRPGKPPGTNGKAIAALLTALIGLIFCGVPSIVGLVLGIIAMRETKHTGQDGYGLALAGTIVGAVVIALWAIYLLIIIIGASQYSTYSVV